jgi:glucose-1-phosphate cytidylyltransferase
MSKMKVAILAGGFGSRIAEETEIRPKPMVEIGGYPILWHIRRFYAHYGFKDFVVALGYKGEYIKKYFADYCSLGGDVRVDFKTRQIATNGDADLGWTVNLVETGIPTNTGGRIRRLARHVGNGTFMLTWGDGVSNVNLHQLLKFHQSHGKLATLTAVRPPARYGHLDLDGRRIIRFSEKPQASEGWINGAFFVLEPKVLDYIESDNTQFEKEPLERLARDGQLMAFQHESFWQCMDTLREKFILQALWDSGQAPWKVWS